MECSLVRDYVIYIIMSKLICSQSADKDEILYRAIDCSVIYKIDEVSNQLMVD